MSDYNFKNTNNNKICWVCEGRKKNYNIIIYEKNRKQTTLKKLEMFNGFKQLLPFQTNIKVNKNIINL